MGVVQDARIHVVQRMLPRLGADEEWIGSMLVHVARDCDERAARLHDGECRVPRDVGAIVEARCGACAVNAIGKALCGARADDEHGHGLPEHSVG
eukprot:4968727-Prymnesium_polylepis.1